MHQRRSTLTRIKGFSDSTEFTVRQYDMQHLNMHSILLLFPGKRSRCNCCDGPQIDALFSPALHHSAFQPKTRPETLSGSPDKLTAFCLSLWLRKGRTSDLQLVFTSFSSYYIQPNSVVHLETVPNRRERVSFSPVCGTG